jgi:hypothetical protein
VTTRALAAGALLLAAMQAAEARNRAAPQRRAAARCDKTYAREFTMARANARVRLRLMKLAPPTAPESGPPVGESAFDGTFQLCRSLGPGWQIAPGSFSAGFLAEAKRDGSPALRAALAACPVTYRPVDSICAACVAGSQHCPCAERDISDWIFCEHR